MSSVTRFMKQVPSAITYYAAPSSPTSALYDFVPSASNTVGNYPPGYMTAYSSLAIPSGSILRDMGKTVYAGIGSSATSFGYFRQMQVIVPSAVTSFIGGSAGSNFGVIGDGNTPVGTQYYTVYLAVPMNGIISGAALNSAALAGGQL